MEHDDLEEVGTMDLPTAEKLIRRGALTGVIIGALTLFFVVIAVSKDSSGALGVLNDAWYFLDAFLALGLSVGVARRSRVAASMLLFYFIASQIIRYLEAGRVTGLLIPLVIVYFLSRATEGTFVYHRIRREQDPTYRPPQTRKMVWIPAVCLFVLFIALGIVATLGPPTGVVAGDDLSTRTLQQLREEGILESNEQVVLFYSGGFFSVLEDGNLITDRRVISYETVGGELWSDSATFAEIVDVSVIEKGGAFSDTLIAVELPDLDWFYLTAPIQDGGDERFLAELGKRMEPGGGDSDPPA